MFFFFYVSCQITSVSVCECDMSCWVSNTSKGPVWDQGKDACVCLVASVCGCVRVLLWFLSGEPWKVTTALKVHDSSPCVAFGSFSYVIPSTKHKQKTKDYYLLYMYV